MPAEPSTASFRAARALLALALSVLLIAAFSAPAAHAEAEYAGASASGEIVFFTTSEKLVPADTDNKRDVYERFKDEEPGIESYVTREISTGPAGGNDAYNVSYDGVSKDGTRVFFSTDESLVGEDTDLSADIYMRNLSTGTVTLVSKADASCLTSKCGNGAFPVSFDAVSEAGSRVIFSSEEPLSGEDEDSVEDVYIRDLGGGGTTRLVSAGESSCIPAGCGKGPEPATFSAASTDALSVAFETDEALSGEDSDVGASDIYARDIQAGTTSLVSREGACPSPLLAGECTPIFGGMSGDGSHIFFETGERVAAGEDTDKQQDVYAWSGAAPILVSTGTEGEKGNGAHDALFAGASLDGTGVFFETDEKLSASDADGARDVYEHFGGETILISTGPTDSSTGSLAEFDRASPAGSIVLFSTTEKLTSEDTDSARDVYSRDVVGKTTTLVSRGGSCAPACGNGVDDASFAKASTDASTVFFETDESLVSEDKDSSPDVYERSAGTTTLVSKADASCPYVKCGNVESNPHLEEVSQDGEHAFFTTEERLTGSDTDGEPDVYDHSAEGTLLVSTRNPDELVLGPAMPELLGTNPSSPNVSTELRILGQAGVETSIKIYATPDCSGVPVATGSAAELEAGGIPVTVAPGSTTTFHATATYLNDTSGCSTDSVTYQQAAPGGGGEGGGGGQAGGGGSTGGGSGSTGTQTKTHDGGIAYVTPEARITFGPSFKTKKRRPVFRFADATGQPGTTFLCKLDRHGWHSCGSPVRLQRLGGGRHAFEVKAVNAIGVWEPQPTKRSFKVVRG
ncbi:MAG: hypothetical protein WBM00_02705 [Solirubrobacterales bacterium]